MNLTPPEFVALIPSTAQDYEPPILDRPIIGYTFRIEERLYYHRDGGVTMDRSKALVYDAATVVAVCGKGGWGHRSMGTWRAVYAY